NFIAVADGVAGGAVRSKGVATLVPDVDWGRLIVTGFGVHCLRMTPVAQPVPDHVRQKARIIGSRVAHPLAAWFVADQDAGRVAIAIIGIRLGIQTKLLADEIDIGLLAREESPSRADVVFVPICLEHLWSVILWIDSDGIKENVFANAITQHLLHLRQARGFQRT